MRWVLGVISLLVVSTGAAAVTVVEPPLSRGDAMPGVALAVDDFIACSRIQKRADLGKHFVDKNWSERQTGYGSFVYCGAVVHWDAPMAKDMKQCLDKRSFGEDVDCIPTRKRGGKSCSVKYDCGSVWLNLGVEVVGYKGKVVSMDEGEKP